MSFTPFHSSVSGTLPVPLTLNAMVGGQIVTSGSVKIVPSSPDNGMTALRLGR